MLKINIYFRILVRRELIIRSDIYIALDFEVNQSTVNVFWIIK